MDTFEHNGLGIVCQCAFLRDELKYIGLNISGHGARRIKY